MKLELLLFFYPDAASLDSSALQRLYLLRILTAGPRRPIGSLRYLHCEGSSFYGVRLVFEHQSRKIVNDMVAKAVLGSVSNSWFSLSFP